MDKTLETLLALIDSDPRPQASLSEHLGIPPSSVSDWRSQKSRSYMKYLRGIADHFSVSVDMLVNGYAREYLATSSTTPPGKFPVIRSLNESAPLISADNIVGFEYACYRFINEFFGFESECTNELYVIHRQNYADDGDVILIRQNGGTVCNYSTHGENVILTPVDDPSSPMCFSQEEVRDVTVGAVTEIRRKLG